MTQGINRSYIFDSEIDIKFYIKNMYKMQEKYNVIVIAYCIMHNHAHILIKAEEINSLSRYMHNLNTIYGQYYNKKYNRVGYVFRDRYKAEGIYNEEQLNNCINYIYNNPVKARICNKPEDYKFSNYKKINIKPNDQYSFIDIEEDKKSLCAQLVKEFLMKNNIELHTLKKDKTKLREIIIKLRRQNKISFRTISNILKINRETIRKEYNK